MLTDRERELLLAQADVWADCGLAMGGLQCALWSADRMTDGVIKRKRVRRFGASDAVIEQAVADGLPPDFRPAFAWPSNADPTVLDGSVKGGAWDVVKEAIFALLDNLPGVPDAKAEKLRARVWAYF